MDLFKSLTVAASGLRVQAGRMRIIAENIANADTTATSKNGDPYRRKVPTFEAALDREMGVKTVQLGRVKRDVSAFRKQLEPGNPAADGDGYVKKPNVDTIIEMVDMREAQRSYEANLNVVSSTRRIIARTLDILRA